MMRLHDHSIANRRGDYNHPDLLPNARRHNRRRLRTAMRRMDAAIIAEEIAAAEEGRQEQIAEDARREAQEAEWAALYEQEVMEDLHRRMDNLDFGSEDDYSDDDYGFTDDDYDFVQGTHEIYDCYKCNDGGWNYNTNAPCTCSRSIPSPNHGFDDTDAGDLDYGYPAGDWRNRSAAVLLSGWDEVFGRDEDSLREKNLVRSPNSDESLQAAIEDAVDPDRDDRTKVV